MVLLLILTFVVSLTAQFISNPLSVCPEAKSSCIPSEICNLTIATWMTTLEVKFAAMADMADPDIRICYGDAGEDIEKQMACLGITTADLTLTTHGCNCVNLAMECSKLNGCNLNSTDIDECVMSSGCSANQCAGLIAPPNPSECPVALPYPGSDCSDFVLGLKCEYDPVDCCGKTINTSVAECESPFSDDSTWSVMVLTVDCSDCGNTACPVALPSTGSDCPNSLDGITCEYDPVEFCGEIINTSHAECGGPLNDDSTWIVMVADLPWGNCPNECPEKKPISGDQCYLGLNCEYGATDCCGETLYSSSANCEKAGWVIQEARIMCDPYCGSSKESEVTENSGIQIKVGSFGCFLLMLISAYLY